jgi:hypothetical protein
VGRDSTAVAKGTGVAVLLCGSILIIWQVAGVGHDSGSYFSLVRTLAALCINMWIHSDDLCITQRNFTEISRVGEDMTARLWLEVKDKNDEFSECVGRIEIGICVACPFSHPASVPGTHILFLFCVQKLAQRMEATKINDNCSVDAATRRGCTCLHPLNVKSRSSLFAIKSSQSSSRVGSTIVHAAAAGSLGHLPIMMHFSAAAFKCGHPKASE